MNLISLQSANPSHLSFAGSVTPTPSCQFPPPTTVSFHLLLWSWLDDNSLLVDFPKHLLKKLQRVQNHVTHIVFCRQKVDHVTPLIRQLPSLIPIYLSEWSSLINLWSHPLCSTHQTNLAPPLEILCPFYLNCACIWSFEVQLQNSPL